MNVVRTQYTMTRRVTITAEEHPFANVLGDAVLSKA
jgi:hypothetical protein